MSYYGGGGQNGGGNRGGAGGNPPQTTLLTGPQLFVNSASQLQFQTGGGQNYYPQGEGSQQSHVQLNTGGPLLLQPPVNFVTDGLGVGISQLITQGSIMNLGNVLQMTEGGSGQGQGQSKQRVFTGMVTKIHDNFGFIDEEVFFQMGVVKGPILPKEGDRVLVEADYNPSMPFKWNATRVQIVNMGGSGGGGQVSQQSQQQQGGGGYGGYSSSGQKQVPPPPALSSGGGRPQQSSVNMVANPHHASMYGSSGGSGGGAIRGSGGGGSSHVVHGGMNDSLMGGSGGGGRRPLSSQLPPHIHPDSIMSSGLMGGLPPLMPKMDSGSGSRDRGERERERERKEKSRSDGRSGRDARSRSKERSRRERSRERPSISDRIRRSRSKSMERRPRGRSPSPPVRVRRSRDRSDRDRDLLVSLSRDRGDRSLDRERDRDRERVRERERERSPIPIKSHRSDRDRVESSRSKRSRSRDTIKSSEGKGSSSTHHRDKLSRSVSPSRRGTGSGGKSSSALVKCTSRYSCDPPSFSLDLLELNEADLKSRYKNLHVPSDFFLARGSWMEAFPLNKPYQLSFSSSLVHIMGRRVERLEVNFKDDLELAGIQERFNQIPNVLQAPDSSCTFSVKVMILSAPSLETIFRKSGFVLETDTDTMSKDITTIGFQTLQRLLNFVVGVKTGKHDIMALGGKWSPSLDGPDPQSNPRVLINTAIRCCKGMASLDLTRCKYWYRFMEIYYRRSNGNLETVVYFLPDLSSCVPAQNEWDIITKAYRVALYGAIAAGDNEPEPVSASSVKSETKKPTPKVDSVDDMDENWETGGDDVVEIIPPPPTITPEVAQAVVPAESQPLPEAVPSSVLGVEGGGGEISSTRMEVVEECNGETEKDLGGQDNVDLILSDTTAPTPVEKTDAVKDTSGSGADGDLDTSVDIYDDIEEIPGAGNVNKSSTPGTHHSQLDLNCMTVAKLRDELALRNLNTKGLKAQLTSRLQEALDSEKEKETEPEEKSAETVKETIPVVDELPLANNTSLEDVRTEEPDDDDVAIVRFAHPSTIFETSINEEVKDGNNAVALNNEKQEESKSADPETKAAQPIDPIDPIDEIKSIKDKDEEAVLNHINIKSGDGSFAYPILKSDMKVEERKLWERRFALPKSPRALLFPASKVASSSSSLKKTVGPFDCSLMPLTSLRDYRHVDKREESFEVSLFAEFFYEMLQRDFGFRIYSEIVRQAGMIKNSDKDKESDEAEGASTTKEEEPATKKRKTSSAAAIPGVINTMDEKDTKVKTVDPLLLLAFTFFDENQAGHITETHVEGICSALGLGLTRHEVKRLLSKVTTRGCLFYREWTDKTETEIDGEESEQSLLAEESKFNPEFMSKLSKGNKNLLPVFTYSTPIVSFEDGTPNYKVDGQSNEYQNGESVLATVDGVVVDVKRVKHELEIAEKEKISAEANANVFKNSLTEVKNEVSVLKKSNETLTVDLKKARKQVKELESSEKTNKEMLETFRKSSESFIYRVKDIVKLPHSHSEEKKVSSTIVVPVDKKSTKSKDSHGENSSSSSSVINAPTDNCVDKKK